jgi:hypothetical protein
MQVAIEQAGKEAVDFREAEVRRLRFSGQLNKLSADRSKEA